MESTNFSDIEEMQLLKTAVNLLLRCACNELKSNEKGETSPKNSVFGKAAPAATLETVAKLVVGLSQAEKDQCQDAALQFSGEDLELMNTLANYARNRQLEQSHHCLPSPESK